MKTKLVTLYKVENTPSNEQELTIVAERTSDKMTIYTSDNTWITKLNKLIIKNPEDYQIIWTNNTGSLLKVPVSLLTLRAGKNQLTAEQKEALSIRLKEARKSKKK